MKISAKKIIKKSAFKFYLNTRFIQQRRPYTSQLFRTEKVNSEYFVRERGRRGDLLFMVWRHMLIFQNEILKF